MSANPTGKLSTLLSNEEAIREGIRNGQCHIVSLAPIREALGDRWEKNAFSVQDFALRTYQREARADDLFIRINEVDFFLIQPSRSSISALSRATALNRLCLDHFLGRAEAEHIRVSVIEQAEPAGIIARRASDDDISAALTYAETVPDDLYAYRRPKKPRPLAEGESPPWEAFGTPREPLRIVLVKRPEGHDLEASYYTEPLWHAGQGAVAIFQLRSQTFYQSEQGRLLVQPDDMTARTLGLIAVRRLTHAQEMLAASHPQGLAINVPLSLHAFAHSTSRVAVMNCLKKIADNSEHQSRLFVEIEEIPLDVPLMRVSEAVAQIKGYLRRVTLRAPGLRSDLTALCRTGADGVILSSDGDPLSANRLKSLTLAAKAGGGFFALDGANMAGMVDLCQAAGVREVCGDAITRAYGEKFFPSSLSLSEILAAA